MKEEEEGERERETERESTVLIFCSFDAFQPSIVKISFVILLMHG